VHLSQKNSRIFVAGHRGLVGSATVEQLQNNGYTGLLLRTRSEVDLLDQKAVRSFFEKESPEYVVLAAAKVGGILANDTYPADFIFENTVIQSNIIDAAFRTGVKRLVFLGSSCIYPKFAPQPMREEHLLTGPLEPTNEWYAIAKISGIKHCQAYRKQHGVDFVSLMPTNMYGPGDNFDLQTSHVLPAMIRKFHEARGENGLPDQPVTLWGTGSPRREFLYSHDLADAIRFVLEVSEAELHRAAPDGILNVGVGEDLRISELAELIREVVGSQSPIVYDATKPDGTPRKLLDVSRMQRLGWKAQTPIQEGIEKTYAWWLEQLEKAA
jgi:GDP-L-fucose synthase